MTMNKSPITQNSKICQILTSIPEKFVVDFANGIDVARDHLRVQKDRSSFYSRCYEGFTGKGFKRQASINTILIDGIEGSLNWLTDLTESLAQSSLAIARVNDRVNSLKMDVATIAKYSFQTRQDLDNLSKNLHQRCTDIEIEINRIDFVQRVQMNLSDVFSRWQAGRFSSFSPAGRCFVALEELRWGAFGDYCRSHTERERKLFVDEAVNRAIAQLRQDLHSDASDRLDTQIWLNRPNGRDVVPDAIDAIAYLGEDYPPSSNPFVFAVSNAIDNLPMEVPKIMSATRLTEALAEDVFGSNRYE